MDQAPLTETQRHGEKFLLGTPTSSSASSPCYQLSVFRFASFLRLPTLSYTVDSFAPAQLALRANLRLVYLAPAPALDCLSLGICAIARVFSLRSIILPCRATCGSLIRRFQLLTLAGLLTQSFSAIASIPERLPKPPGSREIWSFRFDAYKLKTLSSTDCTDFRRLDGEKGHLGPAQNRSRFDS